MAKQKETKMKKETKGNNIALKAAFGTVAIVVVVLALLLPLAR